MDNVSVPYSLFSYLAVKARICLHGYMICPAGSSHDRHFLLDEFLITDLFNRKRRCCSFCCLCSCFPALFKAKVSNEFLLITGNRFILSIEQLSPDPKQKAMGPWDPDFSV